MIFFSGFSLKEDEKYFKDYLDDTDYLVSGFSYGAIKAFEFAFKATKRIDTLQLFSPAFFQTKKEHFKKIQLSAFLSNENGYLRLFIDNCFYPAINDGTVKMKIGTSKELKELLYYIWHKEKIQALINKGVNIKVYLGEKDKIIDSKKAFEFFTPFAQTHFIKNTGHLLKLN